MSTSSNKKNNSVKKLNVLVLCADNKTVVLKPTKLQSVLDYIIVKYKLVGNQKNYYMGESLSHDLDNYKCNVFTSEEDLIDKCKYSDNQFDIIISEGCPLKNIISILYGPFLNAVNKILKPGGIFVFNKFGGSTDIRISNEEYTSYSDDKLLEEFKKYSFALLEIYTTDMKKPDGTHHISYLFQKQKVLKGGKTKRITKIITKNKTRKHKANVSKNSI
jgi:SAM-dependent methyltransferase